MTSKTTKEMTNKEFTEAMREEGLDVAWFKKQSKDDWGKIIQGSCPKLFAKIIAEEKRPGGQLYEDTKTMEQKVADFVARVNE